MQIGRVLLADQRAKAQSSKQISGEGERGEEEKRKRAPNNSHVTDWADDSRELCQQTGLIFYTSHECDLSKILIIFRIPRSSSN